MADLTFNMAMDTTAFDNSLRRGVIKPLEDADKAMEELERDGSKSIEQLEDEMRDAQRSTERFEDSIRDVRDALTRAGRAGRSAGDDVDDGMRKGREGLSEFKDEANSTAREAAASFDGSIESIGDAIQEVAANAFAGFGPAGAIAGLAAAAGIGLAVSAFDAANEASEEAQQAAADWAQAYIDAGSRILSASQVIEGVQAIVTDPQQYKDAKDNAREWGVSTSVALLAMAGDANALAEAQEALRAKDYEYRRQLEDDSISKATGDFAQFKNDLDNGTEAMKNLVDAQTIGAQQADAYSESLRLLAENTVGATKEIDEFGDAVYTLPDGKVIYIDAETGQATQDTDAIERKIYGIEDKTVRIHVDASEFDAVVERIRREELGKRVEFDYVINERRGRQIL